MTASEADATTHEVLVSTLLSATFTFLPLGASRGRRWREPIANRGRRSYSSFASPVICPPARPRRSPAEPGRYAQVKEDDGERGEGAQPGQPVDAERKRLSGERAGMPVAPRAAWRFRGGK
jgi:hypothetical protein